jgi:hypothetical protein
MDIFYLILKNEVRARQAYRLNKFDMIGKLELTRYDY